MAEIQNGVAPFRVNPPFDVAQGREPVERQGEPDTEFVGAVHVHSRYSDGTGDIEGILDAAQHAALDFVLLTDHDTTAARREGWAGVHKPSGVTLIVGIEITPQDAAHCLVLGVEDCLGFARMPQDVYLDKTVRAGGYVAVAHPQGKTRPELGIGQKAWTSWKHPGIQAVEMWNFMHNWIERLQAWRLNEFHRFLRRPHDEISGPEPGVLRVWDRVAQQRRLSGIGGLDCHARKLPLAGVTMFPYEDMFRTIRTHVFLPANAERSESDYLEAIRAARCFVANDYLADSRGTRFWAECDCGARIENGEIHECDAQAHGRLRLDRGQASLRLSLPGPADIRLIANGKQIMRVEGSSLEARAEEKGAYRAEAWLAGRPWIFTNHIYLREPKRGKGGLARPLCGGP